MKTKYQPIIGERFGSWEVISSEVKAGGINNGSNIRTAYWKVRCDCGRDAWKSAYSLVAGKKGKTCKSCAQSDSYKNTFAAGYLRRIKDRASKINVEFDLDAEFLWDLFMKQNKKCALSGEGIIFTNSWRTLSNQTASLDRINNSKGYTKNNVQWVHKDVNFMKHKLDQNYFLELCRKISENGKSTN